MSISPSLQASARAVYRSLFRAASFTFSGDDRVLNAFLDKTRTAYREGRSLTDAKQYEDNVRLAQEVAVVLRANVVQARKSAEGVWKLNIHADSELGDNNTIKKKAQNLPGAGNTESQASLLTMETQTPHMQRVNFSELKRLRQGRNLPRLDERDLEEAFVRGSGPGGQSVNKTENCVQIFHRPSGIRVSCQKTRSLALNRQIARNLLLEKLDQQLNPGLSKGEMRRARMQERDRQRRKKRRKKENLKLSSDSDLGA
ncbi:RF-1 domain-containing protein [Gautieria morchelliformis]|nr:RF-1 domain-containing protein [Gautieria morchelliformis]